MVAPSIPASQLVNVIPGVIGAGGLGLTLNGLILSGAQRVPAGTIASFPNATAVAAYFGATSPEYLAALVYFQGPDNSQIKPGSLLFYQYAYQGKDSAYLRGASVAALGLAGVQAITTGTFTITVDGVTTTSGSVNLSSATSLTNAATLLTTALGASDVQFTGSITTTNLTVTAIAAGTLAPGQFITGSTVLAGTLIQSQTSGTTGGTGVYVVNKTQTVSSASLFAGAVTVVYDSIGGGFQINSGSVGNPTSTITFASGAVATALFLTQATGAVLSQGENTSNPTTAMNAIIGITSNWAGFMTIEEPSTADCLSFAAWTSTQNNRYFYAAWDTDVTDTQSNPTTSLPYLVAQNAYSGTIVIYSPVNQYLMSAFVLGWAASINFGQTNGRLNLAYRSQSGLAPDVTSGTASAQLLLNGCNFYGAYGTPANVTNLFQNGSISGPFLWADSYVNQINLNAELQQAELNLLSVLGNVPYNSPGYTLIAEAASDPINQAINFGSIRAGVPLSAVQAAEVNALAGQVIDPIIFQRGWYLSIQPATPVTRAARGSPPISLFYTDGQSVQQINMFSEEVA